ncbi:hypothetical protein AVEN_32391-1 [Araneus ventricosus]|uniref:Gustatory receptor n=1 Tax=Araneus ventricosus TaxID=182803 RepID=A0A4Y2QHP3_ARAVE|nr:hypothetical protein AVEN_32391-1 [Araneus ventricosus]
MIYCLMCQSIWKIINRLTEEIKVCPVKKFTVSKQVAFLEKISKIKEIVFYVQNLFSQPSLLLTTAQFGVCIVSLSLLSSLPSEFVFNFILILQFSNSCGGILALFWIVGGLPVAANRFRKAFREKLLQRMMYHRKKDEVCFEKVLFEKGDFVLSSCGIFDFQRNSILVLVGTLLSYTIYLVSWHKI